MKPKNLTRLLALGGLAGIAAAHWLPKRYLPFGHTGATIVTIGLLLGVHRFPLRFLGRDAKQLLLNQGQKNSDTGTKPSTVKPTLQKA